jgi:hypothetical protein
MYYQLADCTIPGVPELLKLASGASVGAVVIVTISTLQAEQAS